MALDERYIVASDLEQYFVDKDTGLPLSNGTITFFRDTARNVPKEVFQLSGFPPNYTYTSMGAQITLSAVGTVQNSGGDNEVIYYFPFDTLGNLDLYYVVVKDQNGIEQFTREAWPNVTSGTNPTQDQSGLQNQLSNPTFTNILINDGISTTYTVTAATNQVFEFAPNWDFVLTGTGTVTIQRFAVTGNDEIPTNPPYVLDVNVSSGITQCLMRQRFVPNSGLWSSTANNDIFLAGSFVAKNQILGTTGLQMYYVESSGGTPVLIVDGTFSAAFTLITGSTLNPMPASHNTDSGLNGYVDIYISFLQNSHVQLSNIQLIPTASNTVNLVFFDTDSSNRNEAYQGDYYIPRLNKKTTASYLVGWDFPLNPYQFANSGTLTTTASYIIDQTIAYATAVNSVNYDKNAADQGLEFKTVTTNNAFYILQYLSGEDVKKMVGTRLSVNINAYQSGITNPANIRVYLFGGLNTASVPTLPTTIGTLASTGIFTLTAADWYEIPRSGLPTAQTKLNAIQVFSDLENDNYDYGFSGWQITSSGDISATDKFAIVVTVQYTDNNTNMSFSSISLNAGDIPCRPNKKSQDEVIRECQYYYEKSYDPGVFAGTSTFVGSKFALGILFNDAGLPGSTIYPNEFELQYHQQKRIAPGIVIYSVDGTVNRVRAGIRVGTAYPGSPGSNPQNIAINRWTPIISTSNAIFQNNDATAFFTQALNNNAIPEFLYHYILDARLGII